MGCCNRKLLISESEKKHILSLYGLINEAEGDAQPESQTTTSAFKFDKSVTFAPGYYRLKGPVTTKAGVTYNWDVDQTLNSDLEKIKEFLKKNPSGYIVEVNLYSGESKIPNNDNEKGGTRVEENYLNDARLNSLKNYLNPIFESWKQEGITQTDFKINEFKNVGDTKWVDTPWCPANTTDQRSCTTKYNSLVMAKDPTALDYKAKYDKEQYFRVIIEVKKVESPQTPPPKESTPPPKELTKITEDCATGLRIKVEVAKHNCNNAEFFLFLNNTLLYNVDGGYTANGNNSNTFIYGDSGKKIRAKRLNPGYGKIGTTKYGRGGDLMGERYDEFIVTAEQSKQIIKQSNDGKINVWYICTLSTGCHLDTPTVRIYKDDLPIYEGQPYSDSALLITLDGCGNKVSDVEDPSAIEPDVSSMRETLQNNRMSMVIDDESDVPEVEDSKQKQLKASNTLKTMLDYIDKLFTHPTINTIYFDRTTTKPKTYQKTQSWKNATYYINYDLPENKELFDWFRTKLEDQSFLLYKDEITRLIKENKYEMKDGQFVDKTIRNDKLFGDVRQNLENFYNSFNRQFYFDDFGNVYLKGDDESYPLDYVTMLSKVSNPSPIYEQKQIKRT